MPQNQQQKNRKLSVTSSSSKKSSSKEKEQSNLHQQYRRSRNDDGSSDVSDDEYSDASIDSPVKSSKQEMEEFDKVEYAKLLAELFPSKYSVNKARTLQTHSKSQNVQSSSSESESEKEEKQYPRRSARLQKQNGQQEKQESRGKKETQETQGKKEKQGSQGKKETQGLDKKSTNVKNEFHQSKKQKYNEEKQEQQEENLKNEPVVDKNGNYNIVINLQEPQFDYLSDRYDENSELNDSVFDDESISSDQGESSGSDETYRESDDYSDDDSEESFSTESSHRSHGCEDESHQDYDEQEQITTHGFRKNSLSSSNVASKTENINFTINGKSILGEEKDKVNYKKDRNSSSKSDKNDKNSKKDDTCMDNDEDDLGSEDEITIQTIKSQMQAILEVDKNNKIARNTLEQMIEKEERIKRLRKEKSVKQMRSNTRKFGRLLQKKNSANDLKYFKKYLTHEQQTEVLKELAELNKIMLVDKPYRLTLLESKIPQQYKAVALKRIQNLRYMDTCSGEYFKVKNWVDTFMTIPFGVHKTLSITMDVGVEQCHTFMETAKDILDSAVYGLNDAKMQIMQMVGQWISNPSALGSAIAIKGPPGTGKTTLVKEGISKILGRDFAFIALGGATDSSFLEGHSYTYEGSTWGKIVEILIRCKSMNPVIFFDELDKLSDTPKGEEITGILTHLTDTSQNSQFHDKYFSEIAFDLSKCLFIFSYNDESRVNPILLDRMYRIHTNGYAKKDKTHIAQKYLIPKIQSEVAFKPDQIIIPDETIEYIVEHHTNKEDGVRNLKRCLEIIFTKLNLYRLMKPGSKLFDKDSSSIEVAFPFTVTSSVVDMMIKKAETNAPPMFMYT
jgi:ATP-dependent Lon protease